MVVKASNDLIKSYTHCTHIVTKYHIYLINHTGHLLNFRALRVGAHSRWTLIREFSPFSASVVNNNEACESTAGNSATLIQ